MIEKTVRLIHNLSGSQKIVKSVTKKTRKLQNDFISDANRSTSNEHFTYKKRPFAGTSLVKQIIRCLYPSDVDDKKVLEKPDVVFTLQTFVELFRI